jgi:hypothetical protein
LTPAASKYPWREYTNGMKRSRRAFGAALSAVLLLAMVLPALCGKCRGLAAHPDCARDDDGTIRHHGGSSSGYTDCDHCDGSQGISAARQAHQTTPEFVIFLGDSGKTQPQDSNRTATTSASSPASSVSVAVQKYVSVREKRLPKSVYRPFTVSLKI